MKATIRLLGMAALMAGSLAARSQSDSSPVEPNIPQLTVSGQIVIAGKPTPYRIRHLPVSSFPELPAGIVGLLNKRGCTIPQTYEARRPENVVHASLKHAGSSDWAVLCSVEGTVSLLVIFGGREPGEMGNGMTQEEVLASAAETDRLQAHDPSGVLGFNWGIDPATPQQVHDAQVGMEHRPARVDHDALADSTVEHRTIYRFYAKRAWTLLDMPD